MEIVNNSEMLIFLIIFVTLDVSSGTCISGSTKVQKKCLLKPISSLFFPFHILLFTSVNNNFTRCINFFLFLFTDIRSELFEFVRLLLTNHCLKMGNTSVIKGWCCINPTGIVTPCSVVVYQHFGGSCCLHLQKRRQISPHSPCFTCHKKRIPNVKLI
jgi:hypothetical protein